ncbi:MAG: DUF4038 domain-containing protein, partial [Saprospiraceae bacterium]|nr:DUF4038 domain-containing protein [Saprospiraceae bacterium]
RYRSNDHIIWVLGGDVQADFGGDFLGHYRSMAEGIIFGITGQNIAWNENSPYWNYALMTYHPDGSPMKNSSTWFHDDAWLDFNMIETFVNVNSVYEAVTQDYTLSDPIKPTVMGEPAYENHPGKEGPIAAIQVRRQGWQSFFAGAAGFTYGAFRDSLGNGPLFSPFNHWEKTLNWEGAKSLAFLKSFCLENNWPHWKPNQKILGEGQKEGEYLKTAVQLSDHYYLIYFPDRSTQMLIFNSGFSEVFGSWYNPKNGLNQNLDPITLVDGVCKIIPPDAWSDAVAVIHLK